MKPMVMREPKDKKTAELLRKAWANRCDQLHKPPARKAALADQLGLEAHCDYREPSLFDCCMCNKPYKKGDPLIHDGSFVRYWCEDCIRELDERLSKAEAEAGT